MAENGDQFAKLNREILDLRRKLERSSRENGALWDLLWCMTSAGEGAEESQAVEVESLRAEIDALREERDALQEQAAKLIDEGIALVQERDALASQVVELRQCNRMHGKKIDEIANANRAAWEKIRVLENGYVEAGEAAHDVG